MAIFTNYATLTYNGVTVTSNTVTGELPEVLQLSKVPVTEDYTAGDRVTYVISLVNTGGTALTGLTLTDDLGGYAYEGGTLYPLACTPGSLRLFLDGELRAAPAYTPGPPLVISGVDLPAGASAELIYETAVTAYAPLTPGSGITNTVTASGAGAGPISAQATVTPENRADLRIQKQLAPDVAPRGSDVTYTFTIQNYGNTPAAPGDDLGMTDLFRPVLTGLQAAMNGTPWVPGTNYSYDEATGLFSTLPGQLSVPAAVYTRDSGGVWTVVPGETVLTVTGRI